MANVVSGLGRRRVPDIVMTSGVYINSRSLPRDTSALAPGCFRRVNNKEIRTATDVQDRIMGLE
jgi:hypothetical protein